MPGFEILNYVAHLLLKLFTLSLQLNLRSNETYPNTISVIKYVMAFKHSVHNMFIFLHFEIKSIGK